MRHALVALLLVASCDEVNCNNKPHLSVSGYTDRHVRIEINDRTVTEQVVIQVPVFIPMPFHVKASPAPTAEKP